MPSRLKTRTAKWCSTLVDKDWIALDTQEVVRIETCLQKTIVSDMEWDCTHSWSQMDWEWPGNTEDTCGKIHLTMNFRSVEGSQIVGCMIFISAGRHRGSQCLFRTVVWWMATQYWGGFSDSLMAGRDILANADQQTCGVSGIRPGPMSKAGASSGTREQWKYAPQCTSSTTGGALCSLPGQIPHI